MRLLTDNVLQCLMNAQGILFLQFLVRQLNISTSIFTSLENCQEVRALLKLKILPLSLSLSHTHTHTHTHTPLDIADQLRFSQFLDLSPDSTINQNLNQEALMGGRLLTTRKERPGSPGCQGPRGATWSLRQWTVSAG